MGFDIANKILSKHSPIGLVLGTGGARGLAHIGVIKALEENHIPIDIITGTSIGALIGGLYASGKDICSMEKIVNEINKMMVAKILIPKFFAPGFIDNRRIIEYIKELVGEVKIEDLNIPFAAVATDFFTGEEVIFKNGYLFDAIMASIAIPTIFQPVFVDSRCLIDGGLSNPLPISVAIEMKAKKIIAVNVSPNPKRITSKMKKRKTNEVKLLIKKLPGIFSNLLNDNKLVTDDSIEKLPELKEYSPTLMNVFLQSISISTNNLMAQHLRSAKPDVLISPKIESYDLFEFYKGNEIVKCGYDETIKSLSKIQLSLKKK